MKRSSPLRRLLVFWAALAPLFAGASAQAWTSAEISHVEVRVELDEEGRARVQTDARFVVNGGRFHGFDIAELPGAELVPDECQATTDDGNSYPLKLRRLRDGRTRIFLARKQSIKAGGVTFRIVHGLDMKKQGALRRHGDGARLEWTPLVWDHGLEWMRIAFVLPSKNAKKAAVPDPVFSKDYIVKVGTSSVEFLKHRAPRWYEMSVALDTGPDRFASLGPAPPPELDTGTAGAHTAADEISTEPEQPEAPFWATIAPALGMLLGLFALVFKYAHVSRIGRQCGVSPGFVLLRNTPFGARIALTLVAFATAYAAQLSGSISAGIPPVVAGSAIWLVRRAQPTRRPQSGGVWRPLDEEERCSLKRLARAYRSQRSSWFDLSSLRGVLAFGIFVLAPTAAALTALRPWPLFGGATIIFSIIPGVTVWLHAWNAELPQDVFMEQFLALDRRRRALDKLARRVFNGARPALWVREGSDGPLEIRVRIDPLPKGVHRLEIAAEPTCCGSMQRTNLNAMIGLEPGSATARRIAGSSLVAEHHLTPDLSEEVVLLRNRRGRRTNLSPLTSALAPLWR